MHDIYKNTIMSDKTLGIDLGTNSLGLAIRENDEISWFGVRIFQKGVGFNKSGEFSRAAERTSHRASRRLYNARRYRKWATLKVLIKHDYCPLSMQELNTWKDYDKGRKYPIENKQFDQWIKLDFNKDGIQDYKSPYQLRKELIETKLDLENIQDRLKIGRALYHIAQRRGFKSSRKSGANEKSSVYEGSKETPTVPVNEYIELIEKHGTLGAALAVLENKGERVRQRYTLRKHYEEEVVKIANFQNISFEEEIRKAIFYQRPLRSQKWAVGKCTLEKNKTRIPISHPLFEKYRAWCFLNNIKFRKSAEEHWEPLPIEVKQQLLKDEFYKLSPSFKFKNIIQNLNKKKYFKFKIYHNSKNDCNINFSPETTVSSSYISARLAKVFGEKWEDYTIEVSGKDHAKTTVYSIEEIWHTIYSYDDEDIFHDWCSNRLKTTEEQLEQLIKLWNSIPQGYGNLSKRAITNIMPFLEEGIIYSRSVLLAKIPDLIGTKTFKKSKDEIYEALEIIIHQVKRHNLCANITNNLIASYHNLPPSEKFAYKDFDYTLDATDLENIDKGIIKFLGKKTWVAYEKEKQQKWLESVKEMYQSFFKDSKRSFIKRIRQYDELQLFLMDNFDISKKNVEKLYHPSQTTLYPKVASNDDGHFLLPSPQTSSFRNPMAMRTLFELRKAVNALIKNNLIDEHTRIVVEVARELNNANERNAITRYQKNRETENQKFREEIRAHLKTESINVSPEMVRKYRLWMEQEKKCIYTGKTIGLSDLFNGNKIDFEHTIARSQSFDNTLANQTVCFSDYNRGIKKNKLPCDLPNYENDTADGEAIKPRLVIFEKQIQKFKKRMEAANSAVKGASTPDQKDKAIQNRHIAKMHVRYWNDKLYRFRMTEIKEGFKRSQLTDTQLISKYALQFLKSAFQRVDVQKGAHTSDFRKIFGIQERTEAKNRSKHSHHAMDAAVLTLIPKGKAKEVILKQYYSALEKGKSFTRKPYPNFKYDTIAKIETECLINHSTKDQALNQTRKKEKVRSKTLWKQGDTIRGRLHQDSFYSKIRVVERDKDGKPLRNVDGTWKYQTGKKEYQFAKRQAVENITDLKKIVDPHLAKMISKQQKGRSLAKTLKEGVYYLDKKGKPLHKIRHVRCWSKVTEPLIIKKHLHQSKKDYKQFYFAPNDTNYAYLLYEGIVKDKLIRKYDIINLFEASQLIDSEQKAGFEHPKSVIINKKGDSIPIKAVLKQGAKVIFYRTEREEILEYSRSDFSNNLYHVLKFRKDGLITFQYHLEARNEEQLAIDFPVLDFGKRGRNGFSAIQEEFIAPRLLLSPSNFNFIIEGIDFKIDEIGNVRLHD